MIFINTMNPVTIAYHFLKKVQQKYNLREENLLTDTKNKKLNQLISFFEEIVSSHNLIIETEYTLDIRGYPLQHTIIFCQFVESDPKGPGLKYLADWMLFGRVIIISKIEKMRFHSYFDACDECSSYLASRSYEALKKNYSRKIVRWLHLYRVTYFPFRKEFVFVRLDQPRCF